MNFWAQEKAPAGNWVDLLGTNDEKSAHGFAKWQAKNFKKETRVVLRVNVEVIEKE